MLPLNKTVKTTFDKLPGTVYRRFLMLTCAWQGSRAFPGSLIIRFCDNKTNAPIYWCAQGRDEIMPLVTHLNADRPIYGLRSSLGELRTTTGNVQALAAHYVDEILVIQPLGPYFLGGFSTGGLIAFEIAQQLMQKGHRVDLLALLESDIRVNNRLLFLGRYIYRDLIGARYNLKNNFDQATLQSPNQRPLIILAKVLWWTIYPPLLDQAKTEKNKFNQAQRHVKRQFLAYLIKFGRRLVASNSKHSIEDTGGSVFSPTDQIPLHYRKDRYSFELYPGKIALFFVKWGPCGFYRFKIFQKYWAKVALKGVDVHIISGTQHTIFSWPEFAERLHVYLQSDVKD